MWAPCAEGKRRFSAQAGIPAAVCAKCYFFFFSLSLKILAEIHMDPKFKGLKQMKEFRAAV